MLDRVELNRKIRRAVAACSGLDAANVRPANQDYAATGTYATVLILNTDNGRATNHNYENGEDESGGATLTEVVDHHVEVTASVHFYNANALRHANTLAERIELDNNVTLMRALGLGYIGCTEVSDLSQAEDTVVEERAQLDISFYTVASESEAADWYEAANVSIATET